MLSAEWTVGPGGSGGSGEEEEMLQQLGRDGAGLAYGGGGRGNGADWGDLGYIFTIGSRGLGD